MDFIFTTTDSSKLAGITAARNAYNSALPQTVTIDTVETLNPAILATDQEYVQFVMDNASLSYANQYGV